MATKTFAQIFPLAFPRCCELQHVHVLTIQAVSRFQVLKGFANNLSHSMAYVWLLKIFGAGPSFFLCPRSPSLIVMANCWTSRRAILGKSFDVLSSLVARCQTLAPSSSCSGVPRPLSWPFPYSRYPVGAPHCLQQPLDVILAHASPESLP